MGCKVYANGDEIACKAGDGKVIAAFPDVCLTPLPHQPARSRCRTPTHPSPRT